MKWSFAAIGMFVLGLIGVTAIILFQKLTTSNENDYYLLKEITEASMIDAIDIKTYRESGELVISREKFIENFTRRYAESTLFIGSNYVISFYDIIERPPKVSIIIDTEIRNYQIYDESTRHNYNVGNVLTGILEFVSSSTGNSDPYTRGKTLTKEYYSMTKFDNSKVDLTEPVNLPVEISSSNIKNVKIKEITYQNVTSDNLLESILYAKMKRELDWTRATRQEAQYTNRYFEEINASDYELNISVINNKIDYYNCKDFSNRSYDGANVDCDAGYSDYWIHWEANSNGRTGAATILKFTITWEYDEYEY